MENTFLFKSIKNGYHDFIYKYPTPINLNYYWNFGIYLLFCLVTQILTGILLLSYYANSIKLAFFSIELYMREVGSAFITRYAHANGASLFFLAIFIHLVRGVKYGSSTLPLIEVWTLGIILFILLIAIAFAGYVLPWGQMSYWAATVIIQLFSAIPLIGTSIVFWIWGGFTLGDTSLRRIFSLHLVTPFILAFVVLLHILYLHLFGSGQPEAMHATSAEHIPMNPYYIWKDLNGLFSFILLYIVLVFLYPNVLGHWDNYELGNPLVTPTHITPEWYYLWIYAILRSIPHKLAGVVGVALAIIFLAILPLILTPGLKWFISIFDSNIVSMWTTFAFIIFAILGGLLPHVQVLNVGRVNIFFYFFILSLLNLSFSLMKPNVSKNYSNKNLRIMILKLYRYYLKFQRLLKKNIKI